MILNVLSAAYGAAASLRRAWYCRDPAQRLRLSRPVVSVGNLRVGGSGKTPVVAHVTQVLSGRRRPAVLTRGYARERMEDGVTVVSDGGAILADVKRGGDEPCMLARSLPGVPVLAGSNRYLSGLLAERRFGVDVHVLDDGFQHLQLARTVDLLVVDEADLADYPMPKGHLREPLANAAGADAALVSATYVTAAERVGRTLRVETVFRVVRTQGPPRMLHNGDPVVVPSGSRVFAVAGIARPERFFADLVAGGWQVAGTLAFRDHHPFVNRDIRRIGEAASRSAAAIVLTTEKDAVRFAGCDLQDLPIAAVPLTATIEPAEEFRDWLFGRL